MAIVIYDINLVEHLNREGWETSDDMAGFATCFGCYTIVHKKRKSVKIPSI